MADLNLGMMGDSIKGIFSGTGGFLGGALISILGLVIIGVMAWFGWRYWKNFTQFNIPVTLTKLMDNGMEKTRYDLRGGVFWNSGIKDFRIKIPRAKDHLLGMIPDFSKSMSTDGRIQFITSGDGTAWQQVESKWVTKEEKKDSDGNMFEYDLINKPVARETKQVTVNSIKNWKETIDKSKLTAFTIAIGAFIIMVIAHLVSLYIQTKVKCGL